MLTVTLYTRKNCHLCEQAKADLAALQEKYPHRLVEIDIDSDSALQAKYLLEIPVVEVGPYHLRAPFTLQDLQMTLGAAFDRRVQLQQIDEKGYEATVRRSHTITTSDQISFWFSRHYLALLNLLMALYVGLPFLAPVFMKAGLDVPARVIYTLYSPLCHQFGFRSFYLFGEQPYYPLSEAGLKNVKTFEEVSGITDLHNPNSLSRLQARQFIGNETVGYKVALCERDVAIYLGIVVFGLLFALTRRRWRPLPWMLWLLIGLGPIGLDGFSQLISQFNLPWFVSILPYRESTPFLRVLTGFLFGFATAWFAYPTMEETMREARKLYAKKFAVAQAVD